MFARAAGWVALIALALSGSCKHDGAADQPAHVAPLVFVIETLSKGKGVPEAASEALAKCRALLEERKARGEALVIAESRFGLEGETRLRVELADAERGRELLEGIRSITEGVDLITVREVPPGAVPNQGVR